MESSETTSASSPKSGLLMSRSASRFRTVIGLIGEGLLFIVTSLSMLAVLLIIVFIAKDALPFFNDFSMSDFFLNSQWYPSHEPPEFGVQSILYGSGIVTLGATIIAVPLGVCAAVCLSDILPFNLRQIAKPVVEVLASIPSVAYGFFALVIFAPLMQNYGSQLMQGAVWALGLPLAALVTMVGGEVIASKVKEEKYSSTRKLAIPLLGLGCLGALYFLHTVAAGIHIASGTNALNVSIVLGVMALPTIVSVAEDALQAAGPELRMASYGLGATRAETLLKVIIPASASGICAAVLLGIMRAIGETMVVWMASGNAAQIPTPWYDVTAAVRTLTATIAGDMGETAWGTPHYHALFSMALCLLIFSFGCNMANEWVMRRNRKKLRGE